MKQLTVEALFRECATQIRKGNGKKHIVLSDDNEGNGYHGMYYGFTDIGEEFKDNINDSDFKDSENAIILG